MSPHVSRSDDSVRETLARICDGVVLGIRREIERRAKAGEPIVIQRNGKIETIWPVNGAFPEDAEDSAEE